MKFEFKAKNSEGEIIEGVREEVDRFRLSHELISEGLIPISITSIRSGRKLSFAFLNEIFIRIKLHEKIIFARNLGSMLSAGLSLSRSLSVLERQTDNIKLRRVVKSISEDVESGKSLSQALARFPNVFPSMFVAMVEAGEESGGLPDSLRLISEQLDKTYTIRTKIRSALVYPFVIFIAMMVIGVLMLIYVVPNMTSSFKEFKVEMPFSTKIIIDGSDFLINHMFLVFVLLVGVITAGYIIFTSKKGKRFLDFVLIKAPLISNVVKQTNSATTARTISSLVSSGVTIVKSLEITKDVLQNSYYKEVMEDAVKGIQKGEPLSDFFKREEKIYPILLGEMTEVGEETGNLPQMLMNVAVFYENEVDATTKDMSTIVEPFLMLIIGSAVGFFAVAMIQPIYALSTGV